MIAPLDWVCDRLMPWPNSCVNTPAAMLPSSPTGAEAASGAGRDYTVGLAKVQELLAQAIGPVAGVVMQDCVNEWNKVGGAADGRVDQLIEMLCKEIEAGPVLDTFRMQARDILNA